MARVSRPEPRRSVGKRGCMRIGTCRAYPVFPRLQRIFRTTTATENGPVFLRSRRADSDRISGFGQVCADVQGRLYFLDCTPWTIWPRRKMVEW